MFSITLQFFFYYDGNRFKKYDYKIIDFENGTDYYHSS